MASSIVNCPESVPKSSQVTDPIGAPFRPGAGDRQSLFSATVVFPSPVMPRLADSRTSVTDTVNDAVAVLASSSVAVTVTA